MNTEQIKKNIKDRLTELNSKNPPLTIGNVEEFSINQCCLIIFKC